MRHPDILPAIAIGPLMHSDAVGAEKAPNQTDWPHSGVALYTTVTNRVQPITYGYNRHHMVTHGYTWLQATQTHLIMELRNYTLIKPKFTYGITKVTPFIHVFCLPTVSHYAPPHPIPPPGIPSDP